MRAKLILLGLLAGAAALTLVQLPELRRYLKMRSM
ncbi:DUF6893 family small protein [Rubrobacter naiadicus]